jgi:hypothetical protein
MMAMPEKPKERPSALRSIIAGSTAGAVEIGKDGLLSAIPQVYFKYSELLANILTF